jgi:hypothetical protein
MAIKREVNLVSILLTVICFMGSLTALNWNTPAEAALLQKASLLRRFSVWSKKPKEGIRVTDGVTLTFDASVTVPIGGTSVPIGAGSVFYAIDPPAGKMFDGRITINYDSSVLSLDKYGWFGDWGANPALPPPPINSGNNGSPWYLQTQANPRLTQGVTISGDTIRTIEVNYDWGSEGYTPSTMEHFNFFGLEFKPVQEDFTYEQAEAVITLPQNEFDNFGNGYSVSSPNYNRCIPANSKDEEIVLCGAEDVPEPLTILGSGMALGLGVFFKKSIQKVQISEKKA